MRYHKCQYYYLTPLCLSFILLMSLNVYSMEEADRVKEYERRGNTWPPKYIPDTEGWKNFYSRRFDQVMHMENLEDKWDGFVVNTLSGLIVPNLTENGWGLTRAPEEISQALRDGIHNGLDTVRPEEPTGVITGPTPMFIDRPDLLNRVLYELQPIAEAWVGMKLTPYKAYGFRLYRNESRLFMHIDKTDTHVVSFILHIDSSKGSDPWPIVIEDYQGNTNELILTSGDMLLYESAKCFHGRPYLFNGDWYSSVFVHYFPENWPRGSKYMYDTQFAIPPNWFKKNIENSTNPRMEVVSSSLREPDCENTWCNLKNTIKRSGPGEEGYVMTTGGSRYPLFNNDKARASEDEL